MKCKNPIKIGATFSINLTRLNGTVGHDLTDVQIESFLRHPKFGAFEMDVELINPVEGVIKLILSADDTTNFAAGDYSWDVKFTDPDGEVEIFPKDDNLIITFVKGATR